MTESGCETISKLWEIATKNAAVSDPGIDGTSTRMFSFVQTDNILWSMQIATMKCWEERTRTNENQMDITFPPIMNIEKTIINSSDSPDSSNKN